MICGGTSSRSSAPCLWTDNHTAPESSSPRRSVSSSPSRSWIYGEWPFSAESACKRGSGSSFLPFILFAFFNSKVNVKKEKDEVTFEGICEGDIRKIVEYYFDLNSILI